jgi:methyl-accepting chemotaxis protein
MIEPPGMRPVVPTSATAPPPIDSDGASRPGSLSWFATIRARLYLAFGFSAAMTVVGTLFALYAFTNMGETMTQIALVSMPATIESLRLSEETIALVASAPRLMAAEDESHRVDVANEIAAQARKLEAQIERVRQLDAGRSAEINAAKTALIERLDALDQAVTDRLAKSARRLSVALSIRKAHADFLEGIVPAIDDANFDLMTKNAGGGNKPALNESLETLRHLLEVQAEANLLAGLLTESSLVTDSARLQPLRDLIGASRRKIEANLPALADAEQRQKLTDLYDRLAAMAAADGIIALRASELQLQREAQGAFMATQAEAAKLKAAVDSLVERQERLAQAVSAGATEQIRSGEMLLIALSVTALVVAGLIAWLYVGRNIARRLGLLSHIMRRIAGGDRAVPIPDQGSDEIADMARALLVFRRATADVAATHENEASAALRSEARRRQVEAATRDFERAVSEIIEAFDGASKTMDTSARAMAEAANQNQVQALATATASEQATANVSSVASAAHEMAVSREEISAQVRDSAAAARQAAGEARVITSAVESLADSVGQIGDVSKLIRNIAAQTNLLALNATIEAARAGKAGRGFAVVAQEVKGLAAETEKATEDIKRQISTVEQTTSRAVLAMNTIAGTIGRLDQIANVVAVGIQEQGSVIQEIARSASAAAAGTQGVSKSIDQVSRAATEAGHVAKAVLDAAGELATRSDMLRGEVERFLVQVSVA